MIAFLAFVGAPNLIEGAIIWDTTGFGYFLVLAIGFLIIILSFPSLTLTTFV